jgi:hypothetical protein
LEEILKLIKNNKKVSVSNLKKYLTKENLYLCPICNNVYKKHGISNHIWMAHTEEGAIKEETKIIISKKLKGRTLSNEVKTKLSLAATNNHNGGYRKVPYINYKLKNGKIIKLRGTYEIRFANYLDNNNIEWEYENKLSYIDKNNVKRYTMPDFYIPKLNKYFDTKGYLTKEFKDKINLVFEQNNIKIHLIFLKDLEKFESGNNNIYSYEGPMV